MVALETPQAEIGWKADDFNLKGTDGNIHSLASVAGDNGLLIIFMCNHCPYVIRQLDDMVALANELKPLGVNVVGINANDTQAYPEDSFENMQKLAAEMHFPFPYLIDETQAIAKAYGAVCTPDFFGFAGDLTLQYRGRLGDAGNKNELFEAMQDIAQSGSTGRPQNPSVGCSIKWRAAA